MERVHKKSDARLLDRVIENIQDGLSTISWFDHIFGKAERLVTEINGKRYYTPNIYLGNNEYEQLMPDNTGLGNYCFFTLDDPQDVLWQIGDRNRLKSPFSLIVWVDMRTIEEKDERNTEMVKQEILRVLNGGLWMRDGRVRIERVYEKAENVFSAYTIDEVDNQYLMAPYCGWRFVGTLTATDTCIG